MSMIKARNKLKNRNGISLLIALVYMLIATMIVLVILAAANTATKNFANSEKKQQAYLTVSSAAMYFRDEVSHYVFRLDPDTGENAYTNAVDGLSSCDFAPLMNRMNTILEGMKDKNTESEITAYLDSLDADYLEDAKEIREEFTLSIPYQDQDGGEAPFTDISVEVQMNWETRDVTGVFFQDGSDTIRYQMTVKLPAVCWYGAEADEWSWAKGAVLKG